ncbi:hypothetical protein QJS04_geneDACA000662 [Acorus gramineus]|uniref:Uncharacterized protein n=1 Tax=Acorus gramineus TaxID=55184 RepID=A0AAV9ATC6_ACOGR|nr:hypothetical protein QJS04_geneDACA000662 [Acorus gramineus]
MQHKSRIRNELALLFFFLLFITISPPRLVQSKATGDGRRRDQETKQRPNLVERAMGVASGAGPWEAVRSWVKLALMNSRPSDSEGRHDEVASTAGQVVKDAAMKSFETGKETAESVVKSAAKAATEAAHETKEKVKRAVAISGGEEPTSSEL